MNYNWYIYFTPTTNDNGTVLQECWLIIINLLMILTEVQWTVHMLLVGNNNHFNMTKQISEQVCNTNYYLLYTFRLHLLVKKH